jgi:hypothetical protein
MKITFTKIYKFLIISSLVLIGGAFVHAQATPASEPSSSEVVGSADSVEGEGGTDPVYVGEVVIGFNGWKEASYRSFIASDGSRKYYPFVRSVGNITRTPSDATLYLVLQNKESSVLTVIEKYPVNAQFSRITWPSCVPGNFNCTVPQKSNIIPGVSYGVYLSDNPNGSGIVDFGDSQTSYVNLGTIPFEKNILDITSAKIVNKEYFTINGNLDDSDSGEVTFFAASLTTKEKKPIGTISIPTGPYSFSNDPTDYNLDPEIGYRITAEIKGLQVDEFIIQANGSSGVITDNSITPIIGSSTQNTSPGIVYNECGYGLGVKGTGRICDFSDLIGLVQSAIGYILVLIVPIMAIVFAYAGFLYLTSGGNADKKKAAKKAMTSAVIGIIIILSAWLIVKTIVKALGVDQDSDTFYLG